MTVALTLAGYNDISCILFVLPQSGRPTLDSVRLKSVT